MYANLRVQGDMPQAEDAFDGPVVMAYRVEIAADGEVRIFPDAVTADGAPDHDAPATSFVLEPGTPVVIQADF